MYCNVLASTRCHVFASSLHGKASLLHCKRRLQCSKTDVQNHIGNQLHGVLRMACCAVWSLLLEFHMKYLHFFLPSCRIIISYKFWSKWWTELHSENDRRKVWTNSTWPGSVFHYSKREHHRHWTRGWTKLKCQHCPSVHESKLKDRCFLCDRRRSNLASGEPSG